MNIYILPALALVSGLVLLFWSAERFVDAAAVTARGFNVSPLIIGMVIVGFGTSFPEMVVSSLSSMSGAYGIAVGNAYGSNTTNIGLILGVSALITPIAVNLAAFRKDLSAFVLVTLVSAYMLRDNVISRYEAVFLLVFFLVLMIWRVKSEKKPESAAAKEGLPAENEVDAGERRNKIKWLIGGLLLLIGSSRMLVWGAIEVAQALGVSDLVIGLTIVAIGTSLPELASSVAAVRQGEHGIALGNVLGSNIFNTLVVVGLAGVINPLQVAPEVLRRDVLVMGLFTLALFPVCMSFRKESGVISVFEGVLFLLGYLAYMACLLGGCI